MNILASDMVNIGTADAGIVALLGYGVVFLGLILLMVVVFLVGKYFVATDKKKKAAAEAAAAVAATPCKEPEAPTAPGSAGQLKLYDVEPKTAAMLMAIVADKMGKPLNELRFISIREVKES